MGHNGLPRISIIMPDYIKVTTVDANHVKVEFQDYYPDNHPISVAWYNRTDIVKVEEWANYVLVTLSNKEVWYVSDTQGQGVFQIDDINGTTSWVDLEALATQIAALMK